MKPTQEQMLKATGKADTIEIPFGVFGSKNGKEVTLRRVRIFRSLKKDKLIPQLVFDFEWHVEKDGVVYPQYFDQWVPLNIDPESGFPRYKDNSGAYAILSDILGRKLKVNDRGWVVYDDYPDIQFPILGINPDEIHEPNERLGYFFSCVPEFKEYIAEWKKDRDAVQVPELRSLRIGDEELIGTKFLATFSRVDGGGGKVWINDFKRWFPVQEVDM
jgi:hypothetical protein